MNSINMAFLLTTLAGLSTMLGIIPIFIHLKNENKIIAGSLAFAAGVMSCVSVTDLIPEAILMLKDFYNGFIIIILVFLFLTLGIFLSNWMDRSIPTTNISSSNSKILYKVGIISMVAIIVHNLPEGIATFISTTKSTSLGISLTIAIALHNIPEDCSCYVSR